MNADVTRATRNNKLRITRNFRGLIHARAYEDIYIDISWQINRQCFHEFYWRIKDELFVRELKLRREREKK